MRLLLDENLPKRLKSDFPKYEIYTIRDKNWNGIKNGELMKLLIENSFDALLTFDKNIQFQQNLLKYPLTVFVLVAKNNTYLELTKLSPKVNEYLRSEILIPGPLIIVRE